MFYYSGDDPEDTKWTEEERLPLMNFDKPSCYFVRLCSMHGNSFGM
jgi:hypothetical protein